MKGLVNVCDSTATVHDKYLPDIEIVTYLGLVLAIQVLFLLYIFILFSNLNVYVPMFNYAKDLILIT